MFERIIEALKQFVKHYTGICICDSDAEQEAMDKFCKSAGIKNDEECEVIWNAITSSFDSIVKIKVDVEVDEDKLKRVVEEAIRSAENQKHQKLIRIDQVKTLDEVLNDIL